MGGERGSGASPTEHVFIAFVMSLIQVRAYFWATATSQVGYSHQSGGLQPPVRYCIFMGNSHVAICTARAIAVCSGLDHKLQ